MILKCMDGLKHGTDNSGQHEFNAGKLPASAVKSVVIPKFGAVFVGASPPGVLGLPIC